ncbi:MAG: hypothetical protein FD189_835 [Elusimicrobia bacterium]|nr:MAG: hypothetical protein FD154_828 [Elusimicrobiota bacterium]KAF0156862.1 MAG: hypothetical protein FD189_835 [Elusimicrobiota bacterium]
MKKDLLAGIIFFAVAMTAYAHCGKCPGDKKAGETKAAAKVECPMAKQAAEGAKHDCPGAKAEAGKKHDCPGMKDEKGHDCGKGKESKAACPKQMEGVAKTVKNTKDGVELTLAAKGKEAIARLQELTAVHYAGGNCSCLPKDATAKFANTPAGVKIVLASKKPETVKAMQVKYAAGGHKCAGDHAKEKPAKSGEKAAAKYACPMNCAESDKPGKCPKCGMEMKEKK